MENGTGSVVCYLFHFHVLPHIKVLYLTTLHNLSMLLTYIMILIYVVIGKKNVTPSSLYLPSSRLERWYG
jgi:hypothetical protein